MPLPPMRIAYLSLSSLPSRKANSVQVMKTCAALARQGHEVVLYVKENRALPEPSSGFHDHYGVEQSFRIERLPRPAVRGGELAYTLALAQRLHRSRRATDLVFARHLPGAVVATAFALPTIFEAHGVGRNLIERPAWQRLVRSRSCRRVVAISQALQSELRALGRSPSRGDLIVVPDASDDLGGDARPRAREAAFRIGYAGTIMKSRGIDVLLEVARALPNIEVHIAGGSPEAVEAWAPHRPQNVRFYGHISPKEVGAFLQSCDVLAAPYPLHGVTGAGGGEDITRWFSPLKIFEYMSSGVPMVCSDLPVLREVITPEQQALMVSSDDVGAWIAAVRRLRDDGELASRLGANARSHWKQHFSYDARATALLAGIT
jgi:glycosyltransferase involved in cell wall biosynthesis